MRTAQRHSIRHALEIRPRARSLLGVRFACKQRHQTAAAPDGK
jgi:hypothetical protein